MLAVARKAFIREQLQEHKSVRITELAALLNVTNETIRRDLREMEQEDVLIRTHGGAYILDGVQNDLDVGTRQILYIPEKERIAQKCDAIIQTGDHIFLDGSTTCWFIARQISHRNLTVLTTSLEIANILSVSDTVKLHVIGGKFSPKNKDFIGAGTVATLNNYYVDKALISCRSVHLEHGLTDTNDDRAWLHQAALTHASQKYLVIDHSKLDNVSFSYIAPITSIDGIVMDREFPEEWVRRLTEHNIRIY